MKVLKQLRCGRLVMAVAYTAPAARDGPKQRAQKQKASSAAREKLNARTSFQKLERLLADNFDNGDLFVTLTYDDAHLPDSREKAVRRLRAFIARLRAARKARGQSTHYIYVTEGCCPGGRIHHHLVLNATGEDFEELRRLWDQGEAVEFQRLTFDREHTYEDLARYLTKEPKQWGRPTVGERTWTPSLGLRRSEPETVEVPDCLTLTAPPEALVYSQEGPVRNGFGEWCWISYLLPYNPDAKRPKAKRKRKRKPNSREKKE